jgi:hypothetical protein
MTSLAHARRRPPRRGLVVAALIALAACTRETAVPDRFPVPVIQPRPERIGLLLDEELRTHAHGSTDGEIARLDLGAAHAALFTRIFSGMFREVVEVGTPHAAGVMATFRPTVEDTQISTPDRSKTDYAEASTGPFSGYGRSRASRFGTSAAIREAARLAMRDAGAVVVLKLLEEPAIRDLFETGGAPERDA